MEVWKGKGGGSFAVVTVTKETDLSPGDHPQLWMAAAQAEMDWQRVAGTPSQSTIPIPKKALLCCLFIYAWDTILMGMPITHCSTFSGCRPFQWIKGRP